jgi:hypothetical protein
MMAGQWILLVVALGSGRSAAQGAAPTVPPFGGGNLPHAEPGKADPAKVLDVRGRTEDATNLKANAARAHPPDMPERLGDASQPTGLYYELFPRPMAHCSCACCAVTPNRDHGRAAPLAPTPIPGEPPIPVEKWKEYAARVAAYQAHVVAADEMACSPLYHEQQFQHENFADCTEIAGATGAFCYRETNEVIGTTRGEQIDITNFCMHECTPSFGKLANVGPGGECIPTRLVTTVPNHWQEQSKRIAEQAAKVSAQLMALDAVNATVKRRNFRGGLSAA